MSAVTSESGEPAASKGRTWFITGASRGLGRAFANAALEAGDHVAVTARNRRDVADLEADCPDRVLALPLDVTDRPAVQRVVANVVDRFGRLDVLVNNAGYALHGAIEEVTEDEARELMETNFFGALWITQAVLPYMRQRGAGHIVQVSSIAGAVAFPLTGMYAASKFAVEGMSEAVALEAAPFGIKVTILQPSGFRTGFRDAAKKRQNPIGAYESEFAEDFDLLSTRHAGTEKGDPVRAAGALLQLVDDPNPPLRILLGNRAFDVATAKSQRQLQEWNAFESVARAADG